MLVAAVVILAGVVAVASGRGGELTIPEPDYPPIDLGPVSAADVALLRPPSAAWGYNMRVTDEALEVIARAVTERDVQIAALQQEVSDLHDRLPGGAWPARTGEEAGDPVGPASLADLVQSAEPARPAGPGELEDPLASAEQTAGGASPDTSAGTRPGPAVYRDQGGYAEDDDYDDFHEAAEASAPGAPGQPGQPGPSGQAGERSHGDDPEAAWPGETSAGAAESGSPVPPVAITRPQPLYRRPGQHDNEPPVHGPADPDWDQPAARADGPSAPWGRAQHPDQQSAAAEPTAPQPVARPGPADDHGWGTNPADTSPDAKPLDWAATAPAAGDEAAASDHPSAADREPAPAAEPVRPTNPQPIVPPDTSPDATDWDGRRRPSAAPSVWDVASRQVDEGQPPRPPRAADHAEFVWDEDPHQTLVWGVPHARAKAAKANEETLPNPEHHDDERG
ncbi:MAG: hypothetical protein JO016_05950 [Actinobacteria bacterium]|nr:hypothetical protein [Actinomycetota bacterium]